MDRYQNEGRYSKLRWANLDEAGVRREWLRREIYRVEARLGMIPPTGNNLPGRCHRQAEIDGLMAELLDLDNWLSDDEVPL